VEVDPGSHFDKVSPVIHANSLLYGQEGIKAFSGVQQDIKEPYPSTH
jgi:hypothetical protein